MVDIYKNNIVTNNLEKIDKIEKGTWINLINPTDKEIKNISNILSIEPDILKISLDTSEKPHIDKDDETILITVDAPVVEIDNNEKIYSTMPLGMILVRDDYFVTISKVRIDAINELLNSRRINIIETIKKSRLTFQILYLISEDYIRYMEYISKDINSFENEMKRSMTNNELMILLRFEKTMIYFNASAKSNLIVLQKLARGTYIKLYEEDEDILDDSIIENKQAIEMIATYGEILNGIVDIVGTIVNNNVNSVMKLLTSLTIIIAIPTFVTSFMGMNVKFPFAMNNISFCAIVLIMIIATLLVIYIFKRRKML